MSRSRRNATKVKYKYASTSDSEFDDDEDPDKTEVPGGGKDLKSSVLKNDVNDQTETKSNVGSSETDVKPEGLGDVQEIKDDLKPVSTAGGYVPNVSTGIGMGSRTATGTGIGTGTATGMTPAGVGSTILEQLMSKPALLPNYNNMKILNNANTNMGSSAGMMPQHPYFPHGLPPSMLYNTGMQGYPTMSMPNMNPNQFNNQFFPQGMDMSGFGNMMNAMMMSPNFQALMNPFMMSGNNSALLNQLLSQGQAAHMLQNWATMPQVPNKTLSQMWMMNQGLKMNMNRESQEDDENDDEDMGVAETYADYMPSKLKLGKKHPDPVVETASLSSVEPTDVWYELSLPEKTINSGSLSALQLEAITYASQQHERLLPDESRAGFLIGDGAGVGKGRTIAGIIYENWLKGRKKAIWISVSNDLKYDSERDLSDIGANIDVFPLSKFKYAKINSQTNGNVKKGIIFSTYSALIGESNQTGGKYKTRLKQLLAWCGDDFDGPIIFDECHRAKNLCPVGSTKPTKTGLTVLELQKQLPKARIVYASATGASEPKNMAYMKRLGMWGEGSPFRSFDDFIKAVEKRGVGAMEIVAMDMKLRGMYIARQLSFHGVTFKIDEVPINKEFVKMYDDSVKLWVEAMHKFQEAAELMDVDPRMRKTLWGQFWSAHQRFFKYLCIASKVKHAVDVAREAIKCGKCVVIGLQSTGEARTLEQLDREEGELSDFVSTAKGVLQSLVEKQFPAPDRNRIHHILGIDLNKKKSTVLNGFDNEPSRFSSNSKRKSVRQAAVKAIKKSKPSSDSDSNGSSSNMDSDFQVESSSESVSEDQSEVSEVSSSDFSDLGTESDEMWGSNPKKGKKKKPVAKKPITTQEKIDALLLGKNLDGKAKKMSKAQMRSAIDPKKEAIDRVCTMKEELLKQIEEIGEVLPPNTLDQLIDELGGPENVAEMTGRKGRVVQTDLGIQYESRSEVDVPLETLNLTEKQRFMDGEKDVAIISEAASSGISLQSDRRAKNQRRRVHITLELPWSADRAIQQFGRTHRSNQVNAPEYMFLISDLAGERRFASIVAKRLESLGALTHGDRRATETRDLSRFNIDNKYGRSALESTMRAVMGYETPIVPPPKDYKGDFFKDVAGALVGVGLIINSESSPGILSLDKDYNNISKFLNRILGMPVELQNRLFQYFTDTLQAIITQAKKTGRFDLGILDLGTAGENVKRVKLFKYLRKHSTGMATTEIHIVHVERGMSWDEAMTKFSDIELETEGFYISHQVRNSKQTAILAMLSNKDNASKIGRKSEGSKKDILYTIYRPNTGLQLRQENLSELEKKYKPVKSEEAEKPWKEQYTSSEKTCSHAYWRGNCKNTAIGIECEVGLRRRTYNVLSGSVLSIWDRIERVMSKAGHNAKMQVIRLRTAEGVKIVGTLIPNSVVEDLRDELSSDAEKTTEENLAVSKDVKEETKDDTDEETDEHIKKENNEDTDDDTKDEMDDDVVKKIKEEPSS